MTTFPAITGVILAGGQSSRMGQNKALMTLGSQRLIDGSKVGIAFNAVPWLRQGFDQPFLVKVFEKCHSYSSLRIFQDLIDSYWVTL